MLSYELDQDSNSKKLFAAYNKVNEEIKKIEIRMKKREELAF